MSVASGELAVHDLTVPREQLIDRLRDPLGAVALVDIGVDLRPYLDAMEAAANEHLCPDVSDRAYDWSYNKGVWDWADQRGAEHLRTDLPLVFPGLKPILDELSPVLSDIVVPLRQFANEQNGIRSRPDCATIGLHGYKRVNRLWRTHNVPAMVVWGLTRPGLTVGVNGEWVAIDEVPAGQVLVLRGDSFTPEATTAPMRRQYRSAVRRYEGLAW